MQNYKITTTKERIMKVKVTKSSNKFMENHDYRSFFVVEVDGKTKVNFLNGEPEDANISRDFNGVYSIPGLMKSAHDAGKNGEDFSIEEGESDDFVCRLR